MAIGTPHQMRVIQKMAKVQDILGYQFQHVHLLREGLDVSLVKHPKPVVATNKRLALLGDRMIEAAIIQRWYDRKNLRGADWNSMQKSTFANENFTRIAREKGIYLYTVPHTIPEALSESTQTIRLLSDTVEALIGAVYLDAKLAGDGNPLQEVEKVLVTLGLVHRDLMHDSERMWAFGSFTSRRKLDAQFFFSHHLDLPSMLAVRSGPQGRLGPWARLQSKLHSIQRDASSRWRTLVKGSMYLRGRWRRFGHSELPHVRVTPTGRRQRPPKLKSQSGSGPGILRTIKLELVSLKATTERIYSTLRLRMNPKYVPSRGAANLQQCRHNLHRYLDCLQQHSRNPLWKHIHRRYDSFLRSSPAFQSWELGRRRVQSEKDKEKAGAKARPDRVAARTAKAKRATRAVLSARKVEKDEVVGAAEILTAAAARQDPDAAPAQAGSGKDDPNLASQGEAMAKKLECGLLSEIQEAEEAIAVAAQHRARADDLDSERTSASGAKLDAAGQSVDRQLGDAAKPSDDVKVCPTHQPEEPQSKPVAKSFDAGGVGHKADVELFPTLLDETKDSDSATAAEPADAVERDATNGLVEPVSAPRQGRPRTASKMCRDRKKRTLARMKQLQADSDVSKAAGYDAESLLKNLEERVHKLKTGV